MQTKLFIPLILASVLFTACVKEKIIAPEPDTPAMAIARQAIENTSESLVSDNWYITYYLSSNKEKTELVKNYDFKFSAIGGNLLAIQNGQNVAGKWIPSYIDNLVRLSIDFSYPAIFIEMSGDWMVIRQDDNKITLQNVLRPNDYLTFEKR